MKGNSRKCEASVDFGCRFTVWVRDYNRENDRVPY